MNSSQYAKEILAQEEFITIVINIITGLLAGGLVVLIFYPLEYLETSMHLRLIETRDIILGLKHEYRKGGINQLYLGGKASILGHTIAWGFFFLIFEITSFYIGSGNFDRRSVMLCSFLGSSGYITMITPFTTLKTKLIVEKRYENSIMNALDDIIYKQCVPKLYSGFSISLFYLLEGMIQFIIYQELRSLVEFDQNTTGIYFYFLICGVFSKFIGMSCTYPYRVLQTILQARPGNIFISILEMYKSEGIQAFYRGYWISLMRNLPPSGFLFMLLEAFRSYFHHILC